MQRLDGPRRWRDPQRIVASGRTGRSRSSPAPTASFTDGCCWPATRSLGRGRLSTGVVSPPQPGPGGGTGRRRGLKPLGSHRSVRVRIPPRALARFSRCATAEWQSATESIGVASSLTFQSPASPNLADVPQWRHSGGWPSRDARSRCAESEVGFSRPAAARSDVTVTCSGDNCYGRVDALSGSFTSVSAGDSTRLTCPPACTRRGHNRPSRSRCAILRPNAQPRPISGRATPTGAGKPNPRVSNQQ